MAKKSFAPPVTNFSVSCDPSVLDWLNKYAYEHKTTRSKIIRKAIIDFRAEHESRSENGNAPIIDSETRCLTKGCDSAVLHVPGVRPMCLFSPHHKQVVEKVENPIDE